jgi:hypothetical protein
MEAKELYPKVMVFENALENPQDFLKSITVDMEYVNPWTPWYSLGKETFFTEYSWIETENFPTQEQWDEKFGGLKNPLAKRISDLFYDCTKQYVEKYGVTIPNWSHGTPYLLIHDAKEPTQKTAMTYHTDFIMAQTHNPGYKHWVTCLVYLNDDYEGGEVAFKVFKDDVDFDHFIYKPIKDDYEGGEVSLQASKDDVDFDHFIYKPKAGDVLVLPAHPPYYHGVHAAKISEKVFIRLFWGYEYAGSEEWLANQNKYGKEKWGEMEKERLDEEFKTAKWSKGPIEEL